MDSSSSPAAVGGKLAAITVDYPEEGSIFPPGITPPTFLWRDDSAGAAMWAIDVAFSDGSAAIHAKSSGPRLQIGEIDPRCINENNRPPQLTPQQAAARTWIPDAATWEAMEQHSTERPATITVTGFSDEHLDHPVSRGRVVITTSKDPVGAPIFFRDVPLIPSEAEKGVIKPLATSALPLVAWRLRDITQPTSRLLLTGMHSCANCHSFSRDGKTLGLDLDGPENNKGLYALASIKPEMSIRNQDVISWSSSQDEVSKMRIGFMSQVSPNGRYVLTMMRGLKADVNGFFVVNFLDYRFLQVFYPTRGILVYYDRTTGRRQPLPGADDPRYVQADGVWSPDGKYIVFARAEAEVAYVEGQKLPKHANDPEEAQIKYELYRIPFNDGRGGVAVPIAGACRNGMSNNFPKVSPDGRWIVFVKCRNGQLMRPDSQLYIVPSGGGVARRLRSNTPLMNSWHSFSPNGHWLVFSSKSRSPYTQMYLTHLDEEGNASPAILIDNATAANRAVNIPEFVNVPPDGLVKIDVPAAETYRLFDLALAVTAKGDYAGGITQWRQVLEMDPGNTKAHNNLGYALSQHGNLAEGLIEFQKAVEADPDFSVAQNNLGTGLLYEDNLDEAIPHLQRAMELNPAYAKTYEPFITTLDWPGRPPRPESAAGSAASPTTGDANADDATRQKREKLETQYQQSLDEVLADITEPDQPLSRAEKERLLSSLDIPRLRTLAAQGKTDEGFAAQRQILRIFLRTFETSRSLLAEKRNAEALACLEIAAQAAPGNPYISYNLARAEALNRQNEQALRTLRAAVEKGFNDPDRLEEERAFEGLRTEPDFKKVLAKLREAKPQPVAAP